MRLGLARGSHHGRDEPIVVAVIGEGRRRLVIAGDQARATSIAGDPNDRRGPTADLATGADRLPAEVIAATAEGRLSGAVGGSRWG